MTEQTIEIIRGDGSINRILLPTDSITTKQTRRMTIYRYLIDSGTFPNKGFVQFRIRRLTR